MPTMATGGGKTVTCMTMVREDFTDGNTVVQAHRAELVGQLSLALARQGIEHDLTVSPSVRRIIIDNHLDKLGRMYYRADANVSVESVQTAVKRPPKPGVKYVLQDEGHHVQRDNLWGRALQKYDHPACRWVLPTATAGRADGRGLGVHSAGLVNLIEEGPTLAQQMAEGFLVEYDILQPPNDVDMSSVSVGAGGEFNQAQTATQVKKSKRIVGDAVEHYMRHAYGRLCLVFCVDIEHARTVLAAYLARGVPTELVTGEDLDSARLGALKRFEKRETLVIINVDLFGEGTDIPGVEVVQLLRPTASFPLLVQMVGRMVRLDIEEFLMSMWDSLSVADRRHHIAQSRKPRGLLIDHVGNIGRTYKICGVEYTGPPEGFTGWNLDGTDGGKGAGGAIAKRICTNRLCALPYERFYDACPICNTPAPAPAALGGPDVVLGDLQWYDPDILAELRARAAKLMELPPSGWNNEAAQRGINKAWYARQKAQYELRQAIEAWAARWSGWPHNVNYKRFYETFGIDVPTACTLGAKEADTLKARIDAKLTQP